MSEKVSTHQVRLTQGEFIGMRVAAMQACLLNHDIVGMEKVDDATEFAMNSMFDHKPVTYFFNDASNLIMVYANNDCRIFKAVK